MKRATILPAIAALALGLSVQTANAQSSNKALEALPHHLQARVQQRQNNLLPPGVSVGQGVVSGLKAWQPNRFPITVCFFGGSSDLRRRIMDVALEWTKHGANIPLDFGNPSNPRICTNQESDIKVGFNYRGYWSTIGQDSRDLVGANEQSMNFAHRDVAPASEPEFSSTVLHEFGHALAFQHEHQHPYSDCEKEFDFDKIYVELADHPNFWNKEKVDFNMRGLSGNGIVTTKFDRASIMLYTFAPHFYKQGVSSNCYSTANQVLSQGDKKQAAEVYPATVAAAAAARAKAVATFTTAVNTSSASSAARLRSLQEVQVLGVPGLSEIQRAQTLQNLQAPMQLN